MSVNKRSLDAPLRVRYKISDPPVIGTGGPLILDLPEADSVSSDAFGIVRHNGIDCKVTMATMQAFLADKAYGMLVTTDGNTQSPVVTQTVNGTSALFTGWTANALNHDTTPDYTADEITVTNDGVYEIDVSISFSGTLSKTFMFMIYHEGIETAFKMTRKLGTGGDVGSASLTGMLDMAAGESVSVYLHSTDGGTSVTTHQAQLKVVQV